MSLIQGIILEKFSGSQYLENILIFGTELLAEGAAVFVTFLAGDPHLVIHQTLSWSGLHLRRDLYQINKFMRDTVNSVTDLNPNQIYSIALVRNNMELSGYSTSHIIIKLYINCISNIRI